MTFRLDQSGSPLGKEVVIQSRPNGIKGEIIEWAASLHCCFLYESLKEKGGERLRVTRPAVCIVHILSNKL